MTGSSTSSPSAAASSERCLITAARIFTGRQALTLIDEIGGREALAGWRQNVDKLPVRDWERRATAAGSSPPTSRCCGSRASSASRPIRRRRADRRHSATASLDGLLSVWQGGSMRIPQGRGNDQIGTGQRIAGRTRISAR
jgi:hypothetical protein